MPNTQRRRGSPSNGSRYLAAWLALILTSLTACSAPPSAAPNVSTEDVTAAAPADPSASTTIRWILWSEDIANEKHLHDEIALYNGAQSEVRVEMVGVPWNDFTPKLLAMLAANQLPEVIAIQNEAEFVAKGLLLPLDELIRRDNLDRQRFLPGALAPAYDGKVYGLRHDTAAWLLFYNKDRFDQAGMAYPPVSGWTLDEALEAACDLSNPTDSQWGMFNIHWIMSTLLQQQGLPYLEMVEGVPQYRIDDPRSLALYQTIADFVSERNCQPNADQQASLGGSDPFLSGRAAMALNGNWAFGSVKDNAPFAWGVAPLPGLKQPNVGMKVGIAGTAANQAAAWKFLRWLTYEPQATRFRAERGMGMPAINDTQAIDTFLHGPSAPAELPAVFDVLSDPANTLDLLDVPGISEANNILTPAIDEVLNGLSEAADAIPPAVQQANDVLRKEWQRIHE